MVLGLVALADPLTAGLPGAHFTPVTPVPNLATPLVLDRILQTTGFYDLRLIRR